MTVALTLSSADLARLEALGEALLSPLAEASLDDWRASVNLRARALLQADTAAFMLPPAGDRAMCYSEELSADARAAVGAMHLGDAGRERAITGGLEVWNQTAIVAGDWSGYQHDPTVNEFLKPNGLLDGIGFLVGWSSDRSFGALAVYHDHYGTERMGDKGVQMLRLVLPAFKAGLRAVLRLSEQRAALARALDGLGLALQVRAPDGRVLHETPALGRFLAADAERGQLGSDMARVAHAVSALISRRTKARGPALGEAPYRQTRTATACYRMHASALGAALGSHEGEVLVALERVSPEPLADAALRERYALTRREIQVARLMTEGHSNPEIARLLGVSLHTVRRHAERVREKLDVHRRAAIAGKLRGS